MLQDSFLAGGADSFGADRFGLGAQRQNAVNRFALSFPRPDALDRFAHQFGDDGALVLVLEGLIERLLDVVGNAEVDGGYEDRS